jgi:hypothetical protein
MAHTTSCPACQRSIVLVPGLERCPHCDIPIKVVWPEPGDEELLEDQNEVHSTGAEQEVENGLGERENEDGQPRVDIQLPSKPSSARFLSLIALTISGFATLLSVAKLFFHRGVQYDSFGRYDPLDAQVLQVGSIFLAMAAIPVAMIGFSLGADEYAARRSATGLKAMGWSFMAMGIAGFWLLVHVIVLNLRQMLNPWGV